MPGKVKILPETVQNMIAAGEVVERPASVVKELVENALDAGARNISVEVEDGGHRLIRVSDDGSGMNEDDLVLALERHATSKVASIDDVFKVSSMGFRGEALPSIASVSRTLIASCPAGDTAAHEVLVEGGLTKRLSPAKARKGTLVEVRDLFFNTPARRKFLKKPPYENRQTIETMIRLALAWPAIGFRLQVDGLISFTAHPGQTLHDRILDIFAEGWGKKLLPVKRDTTEGLSVDGYIAAPPKISRNRASLYILVNNRWIRDYKLATALARAAKGFFPAEGYPCGVVNLRLDPERIDVNVHPAKEEVRFDHEDLVKNAAIAALRDALRHNLGPDGAAPATAHAPPTMPPPLHPQQPVPASRTGAPDREGARMHNAETPRGAPDFRARKDDWSGFDAQTMRERVRAGGAPDKQRSGLFEPGPAPTTGVPSPAAEPPPETEPQKTLFQGERYRYLGPVFDRQFILMEGPEGLLVIDPHALHERWNFDRLVAGKRGLTGERLLMPLTLALSPLETAGAREAASILEEHGFALTILPPNRLEIRAAPAYLKPGEVETLVRQVLSETENAGMVMEERRERLLASLACRASVLLGKHLPEEEIETLIDRFFNGGQLPTCPHGRPTSFVITIGEVTRRMGR